MSSGGFWPGESPPAAEQEDAQNGEAPVAEPLGWPQPREQEPQEEESKPEAEPDAEATAEPEPEPESEPEPEPEPEAEEEAPGVVALGGVVRGETAHFEYVAGEAASGLQLAGLETGVPVAFGVLTVDTAEQAEARVDKGADAARAALEMADLFSQVREQARG